MKKAVGALLLLAGLALWELSVFHLVQHGTCASGGPYEIRNPCPHSTWTWLGLLVPAAVVGLIGAGILDVVSQAWAAAWLVSAVVSVVAVYTPGAREGAKTGGIIVGIVWGALGLLFAFLNVGDRKAKWKIPGRPAPPPEF
jgi:hypothetical protein